VNQLYAKPGNPDQAAQPCGKLISICIPTFNRAFYLSETLESLLPQLDGDVELLVYDTGSTDGTPELMREFQRRSSAIRFFHLAEKRGFDETLLLLLEQARGEYVWYFGSDDVLKPGAMAVVRRRILTSTERPALVFLNHEIVDNDGNLLIPFHLGRKKDLDFTDGRSCIPWLNLHLGYISACVFRRDRPSPIADAKQFIGSLWVGIYLNLASLSKDGPALYVGQPMLRARRNPGNVYDYGEIFCRRASQIFWNARHQGIGRLTIYRAMNRIVLDHYLRLTLAWHCSDPVEFRRTFAVMLRVCWIYPWFWLLIVPVRLTPWRLARAFRDRLRQWREGRNARLKSLRPRAPVVRARQN
jgi:abequosyltransferase